MVNGPQPELERENLLELLNLLERNPDARVDFQQRFGQNVNALDELVWRLDPDAVGRSGATNPMLAARDLEVIVHSRPTGADGEGAVHSAESQMSELMRDAALRNARLDAAIQYIRERPSTEAVAADSLEGRVPPAVIDKPTPPGRGRWNRWRTVIGLASAAAVGAVAATVIWSASTTLNDTVAEQLPSPLASSPVSTTESRVIIWVPVLGDLLTNADARRSMEGFVAPDKLLAATSLGIRGAFSARGFLSDTGQVCLSLSDSNGGVAKCATYEDFVATGLSIDKGSWSIRWQQNGTVVWDGI